jgi:hypothetical protein
MEDVPVDDFDLRSDSGPQMLRLASYASDPETAGFEGPKETSTDVSGRSGKQNWLVLDWHGV